MDRARWIVFVFCSLLNATCVPGQNADSLSIEADYGHGNKHNLFPSAIPNEKGEIYYTNRYFTFNSLSYGLTRNISVGGGFDVFSLISGLPLFVLDVESGFKIAEKLHVGADVFLAFDPEPALGIGSALITYGDLDNNVTLGLGAAYDAESFLTEPAYTLAGNIRLFKNISFVSDNLFFIENDGDFFYLSTQGLRFIVRKSAFDVGVLTIPQIEIILPVLPFLGYSRKF